jgi:cysteine desulfurase
LHLANNETGVIQPIAEIAAIVAAAGGVLVVDAVQAAGRIEVDISAACGDFLILSAHKIGGPKGAGAVVARADLMMPEPLIRGGGQERGHRAGTENVAAIAGFGAAARQVADLSGVADMAVLRERIETFIKQIVPDAVIVSADAPRLPNTIFFAIPGMKAETALIAFDLAGIAVSAGSACSSGRVGPSHVLVAMGHGSDASGIRVSIGRETSAADVEHFGAVLAQLAARRVATPRAA